MNKYRVFIWLIGMLTIACREQRLSADEIAKDEKEAYENPVVAGDFADPSVIRVKDTYYATGTSSEWAPELFYHNNLYYVYYVAKRKSDGVSCIGVATSENPEKGFFDQGILLEYAKEAIDPFVFDDNGQLYITWKAYGLDERPIELLGSKLSSDGLKLEGQPFSLLKDNNRRGIEGQDILKKHNYYYLFYSEGGCCGSSCDYDVRVARAASVQGPYEKCAENPILEGSDRWKCPGHGTIVETPDKRYFYLHHAYRRKDDVYTGRQGVLDEVFWDKEAGWPYFEIKDSLMVQAGLPVKGTAQKPDNGIFDDFAASSLSKFWQWDFRHAQPQVALEQGNLCMAGDTLGNNKTGTVLTVRPVWGTYEINTEVVNSNPSLKGLVLYGDVNQAVGIGITGDKVQVWEVKGNVRSILKESPLEAGGSVWLKISVEAGYRCKFYWSQDKGSWHELQKPGAAFYNASTLPQWDRSSRPGLFHYGKTNEPACFSSFRISYNTPS